MVLLHFSLVGTSCSSKKEFLTYCNDNNTRGKRFLGERYGTIPHTGRKCPADSEYRTVWYQCCVTRCDFAPMAQQESRLGGTVKLAPVLKKQYWRKGQTR